MMACPCCGRGDVHGDEPVTILPATILDKLAALPGEARYGVDRFEFAAPGDRQHDMWLLRFDDTERGDMVFDALTYDDPEASAWEAWNRAATSFNCRMFRTAALSPPGNAGLRESIERAVFRNAGCSGKLAGYAAEDILSLLSIDRREVVEECARVAREWGAKLASDAKVDPNDQRLRGEIYAAETIAGLISKLSPAGEKGNG